MRYTVTFEVYVQGDNDKHALHRTPFASLNVQEVDINKLKYDNIKNEELPF